MLRQVVVAFLFCVASVCEAAPYKQLFAGYNGPADPETSYHSSPETARRSWLRDAIGADELEKLIAQVDFGTQLLAVSAIGQREAVTTASLESVNWTLSSVSVYVVIRIADPSCGARRPSAYIRSRSSRSSCRVRWLKQLLPPELPGPLWRSSRGRAHRYAP